MNKALGYLWFTLLKRRGLQFWRGLRRPGTLIGFAAIAALVGFVFYFRRHEVVGHLVEPRVLAGGALLMVFASIFRGFLQRGLIFDPPDIDFLFTGPFTQKEIIFYRLCSNYFFAVVQGMVFLALFASHFQHPIVVAVCVMLFQIICFHLATAAAIYGGSLPELLHHRLRWMMLGFFLFMAALYLRAVWELKLVPTWFAAPEAGLLFYPAVTVPDIANGLGLHRFTLYFLGTSRPAPEQLVNQVLYLGGFLGGGLASLWLLLRLKGNVFEPALAPTTHRAERRARLLEGRHVVLAQPQECRSTRLPRLKIFEGVGAILWKNFLVARRSKRQLLWVSAFGLIYTGFTVALLYLYHHLARKAGVTPPESEAAGFHIGIALFLAGLTFFLQRMVPFDFRHDGHHLATFRTLPVSSLGLALAELSVPTLFCLCLQAPCILALLWFAHFPPLTFLLILLAYPAVGIALNSVWNLHYLLAAAKRASGENVTAVGTLMVVALSFLVFYPAGWTMLWLGHHLPENSGIQVPLGTGLAIQYAADAMMILILARIFKNVEVGRDAR